MIKVIGFDLDDTLWAVKPVIIKAEAGLKAHLKHRLPQFNYAQQALLIARKQLLTEEPSLSFRLTALRLAILTKAMINNGIDATQAQNLAAEAMDVFLEARNQVTFFPGALEALTELAQGYTLGALTNGNADIKRLGLEHLFMFSFSAEQVGAAKPDPALFEAALAQTGIKAHEMIYVGDDPLLDVDAAARLGIRTIWKSNPKKQSELISIPDEQIQQLSELPGAVKKIARMQT
jgi:putative hydrolase of the HAD superfamily